jgi:hypothetical protein
MIPWTNKCRIWHIVLAGIVLLLIFELFDQPTIEGFSYATCRSKGFTPGFCVATPVAGSADGTCNCADGSVGITIKGTGARCICGKTISEPWNQSKKPLLYDGHPSLRTVPRTHTVISDTEGAEDAGHAASIKHGQGSWWFQVKWI